MIFVKYFPFNFTITIIESSLLILKINLDYRNLTKKHADPLNDQILNKSWLEGRIKIFDITNSNVSVKYSHLESIVKRDKNLVVNYSMFYYVLWGSNHRISKFSWQVKIYEHWVIPYKNMVIHELFLWPCFMTSTHWAMTFCVKCFQK